MKQLALLLYFISYTSGIGAITLVSFFYIKTKIISLKYIILADAFFTIILSFDTLNFYTDLFVRVFPDWLQYLKIFGLIFASIGMVYFLTISVYHILRIEVTKRKKLLYLIITVTFIVICISTLYILYRSNLISKSKFIHSDYFTSNIIASLGSLYNIILLIKNFPKINNPVKQFIVIFLVVNGIIIPLSIICNVFQYQDIFKFPLAFSPISYFLINLAAIIITFKNLQYINFVQFQNQLKDSNRKPDFEEMLKEYKLTQREKEIIQLVVTGFSNQEIGEKLFISANTARNHIYNIYKKLGIKNRYELMSLISLNMSK